MQRLSKRFWFTVFAGGVPSLLLTRIMLSFFSTQSSQMIALCRQAKAGCGSAESLHHLFRAASTAQTGGTLLLFGCAYVIGGILMPHGPASKDAGR